MAEAPYSAPNEHVVMHSWRHRPLQAQHSILRLVSLLACQVVQHLLEILKKCLWLNTLRKNEFIRPSLVLFRLTICFQVTTKDESGTVLGRVGRTGGAIHRFKTALKIRLST